MLAAIVTAITFLPCQAQNSGTPPKIKNYTKGELEIKVAPFGLDGNEINVGKVLPDGTIQFSWPDIDLANYESSDFFMSHLKIALWMSVCHDKKMEENNEEIKAVNTKDLLLYKYGQNVGFLQPSTRKEFSNSDTLETGSSFSWYYSNGDGKFKAICTVYEEKGGLNDVYEIDKNNVRNTTTYDINFKKGWNLVEKSLLELKDQKRGDELITTKFKESKATISQIPNNINWHMNYWANDELLEKEHQLISQTPIAKKQFENWLPRNLGDFKRTAYEIGKELERMPSTDNINIVFEKNLHKIEVTIVDCAGNKEAASMYTLMADMASSEWKEDSETGYQSATKMDGIPVMTDYNKNENNTTLSYSANERLLIKAEAVNIAPKELWEYLRKLDLEKLTD